MKTGNGRYEGHFFFDPLDPIYAKHFPGQPVVPGSLIVHAFLTAAANLSNETTLRTIRNFRFKRFIGPGRYAYRMQSNAEGALVCKLLDNRNVMVTGIIDF